MSLNETPAAERLHIAFFGKRNAGKSSIVNALTGQELSIVSKEKGTTTDPVYKAMELLPIGPVMIIDTPGFDDEGELGAMRVRKALQVLGKTDIAVLVIDASEGKSPADDELERLFKERDIPFVTVFNKCDLPEAVQSPDTALIVSARTGFNVQELKLRIIAAVPAEAEKPRLLAGVAAPSDFIVLVVPLDASAPKGRLILPQQQVIRELLELEAVSVVVKDTALRNTLQSLGQKPRLVITDSQVFGKVAREIPSDVLLTSFSILFARYKGDLDKVVRGAMALDSLKDGDSVLMAEGCTHHRQCEDIGTVKLPNWIRAYTKKDINFCFMSGRDFPDDLTPYSLIVHCGGCMLSEREMKYRQKCAAPIPITNYGIAIAHINGILARSLEPFPEMAAATLKPALKGSQNGNPEP